jgi:hypothetical protein
LAWFKRGEVLAAALHRPHRLQGQPLHRVERGRQRGAHRLGDAKTGVGDHQEQRQRAEKHQLGQRRRPLFEKGRRGSVEGS